MKADRLQAHMKAAKAYAELSKAKRLKVGAVMVRDDRVISIGYNGTPRGSSNECEYIKDGKLVTRPEVMHAELNCIAFAAKNGISTDGCTLVVTHSPCYDCSKLLMQAGVQAVYYDEEYRDVSGLEFLTNNNVIVGRVK